MKKILILLILTIFIFPAKSSALLLLPPCMFYNNPNICTFYYYSEWGECSSNGTKIRSITSSYPNDCFQCAKDSIKPILSVSCTPSCTGIVYSDWGECVNSQQTRTIADYTPSGCEGEPEDNPILTQDCISCAGRIYSNWSDCVDDQQERVILYKTPSGCVGEPTEDPILHQSCGNSIITQEDDNLEDNIEDEGKIESIKEPTKNNCYSGSTYFNNICVKIPANAYVVTSLTDAWLCDGGYKEIGSKCVEDIQITTQPVSEVVVEPVIEENDIIDNTELNNTKQVIDNNIGVAEQPVSEPKTLTGFFKSIFDRIFSWFR